MKNSQNQIKTFWKIPDAQQEKLLSLIETEQKGTIGHLAISS